MIKKFGDNYYLKNKIIPYKRKQAKQSHTIKTASGTQNPSISKTDIKFEKMVLAIPY